MSAQLYKRAILLVAALATATCSIVEDKVRIRGENCDMIEIDMGKEHKRTEVPLIVPPGT